MKNQDLRRYIRNKNLQQPEVLKNCNLVIDGNSYFKDSYKKSGCQFRTGLECDRYADYLINQLASFLDSNIKCHVIFKGSTKDDLEDLLEKHQKIIERRNDVSNLSYFEPPLVKDVQKQVLEEMGIRYFCCEYDSKEAIISVARTLKCPVLTHNVEYCLYGVSCVLPDPIKSDASKKALECVMYNHEKHRSLFGVYNKMPILLTILDENVDQNAIPELTDFKENGNIPAVICWVKKNKDDIAKISNKFQDDDKRKTFLDLYAKNKILYLYPSCNLAVKYFQRDKPYGIYKDDKKWFSRGVSSGRIAIPYVDIKRKSCISGSTSVNNVQRPDAMLAASKIIAYSHCVLTNSKSSTLNFIGRKNSTSSIWEIETSLDEEMSNRRIFSYHQKKNVGIERPLFSLFIKEVLPGRSAMQIASSDLPKDCQMLVIALVYYIHNINKDFIDAAYYVLLSYVILGPVSKALEDYKNSDNAASCDDIEDYQNMYHKLNYLFRKIDSNHNYNIDFLHSLAEFQHCLQHMNYLNKLCTPERNSLNVIQSMFGDVIRCTVYHDCYNSKFVYNTFIAMRNKDKLINYLDANFKETKPLKIFKTIVTNFEKFLKGHLPEFGKMDVCQELRIRLSKMST